MKRPIVYLYGPITGLTFDGAQDWRSWMTKELDRYGIDAVSPLRAKEYLADCGKLTGHGRDFLDLGVFSTPQAILARDKFDVLRADMLVGNFLGATQVSTGSMFEHAWAHLNHKPIAAAVEPEGNPHDHIFFNTTLGFRCTSLEALRGIVVATLASK